MQGPGHSVPPRPRRSDCLVKTIRSEGYFGMYRGELKDSACERVGG